MNKEEIEDIKDNLRILYKVLWNENREGTYTIERTLEYINYVEQKESILDKVTDKLKEDIPEAKEKIKYWEEQYRISKAKKDEFYKNSYKRQINKWHSRFETLREIENIIEGEKNKLNSIKQY